MAARKILAVLAVLLGTIACVLAGVHVGYSSAVETAQLVSIDDDGYVIMYTIYGNDDCHAYSFAD